MIRSLGICQSSASFAVYENKREDQATKNKKKEEKLPFNEPHLNIR